MVAGLQGVLDSKLCDSNDAAFRGIPWRVTVELPGDRDLEKNFLDPETNKYTNDPVFPNCLPSGDPDVESDTFLLPVLFWSVSQKVECLSKGRGTELLECRILLLVLDARTMMIRAHIVQVLLIGASPDLAAVLPPNAGIPAKQSTQTTTRTWT
jgi:hypothetical protein